MINPNHGLSLTRQAELLQLSRASLYYEPVGVSQADLKLMRRIDELHLEWPFLGSRMLRNMLRLEGIAVGRKHVATLMRKMGIEAIYRRANTSRRHPRHAIYPYLLRNLTIDRPNQVWATDVTYIPMARGFVYLVAVTPSTRLGSLTVHWTPGSSGHLWFEDTIAAMDNHGTASILCCRRQESAARPRPPSTLIIERHLPQHAARRPASFNAHSSGFSGRLSSIHL
jgi:putative transposase